MTDKSAQVLEILRIPRLTEGLGGISLFDALRRIDYGSVRKAFVASDLVPVLKEHPELVDQWLLFCENKRCGGWWIKEEPCDVGWLPDVGRPFLVRKKTLHFASLEEAVAEFVVRELDDALSLMNNRWPSQQSILILLLFLLSACFFAGVAALYIYYRQHLALGSVWWGLFE